MATVSADLETGDLSQFDSTVTDSGDLSAHADALKNGSYGLKCVIDSTGAIYGRFDFVDKTRLRVGFWFDVNGLTMSNGDDFYLAGDSSLVADYVIRLVKRSADYKMYLRIRQDDNAWLSTAEITITDDWHWIEIDVKISSAPGADDGFGELWIDVVDGSPDGEIVNADNDAKDFDDVLIGAIGSIDATISGTLYYDDIKANDTGAAIGPPTASVIPVIVHHLRQQGIS